MKKIILLSLLALIHVTLNSQTRVVLIEQFSNSSCPPCGAVSPSVYAFADANPASVAVIAYHTLFPYNNDSMYFENPLESAQRVSYYSVSGVPNSVLDGNVFNGSTGQFITNISGSVSSRLSIQPRYDVQALSLNLTGNQLSGSFRFTSLDASNTTQLLTAQIVVIEKNVLKSSYAASPGANNETQYGYVMRKMIPDANGTSLINKSLNSTDDIPLSWTLDHIKNIHELRVVAFVQNADTKEVYQSQMFDIQITPVGLKENEISALSCSFYPNPSQKDLIISFDREYHLHSISVTNQLGELVYFRDLNSLTREIQQHLELASGVYYLKISAPGKDIVKKLVIDKE